MDRFPRSCFENASLYFSRKYAQKVTTTSIKEHIWNYAGLKSSVLLRVIQNILVFKVKLLFWKWYTVYVPMKMAIGHDMWPNQYVCPKTSSARIYELLHQKTLIFWKFNAISNCQEQANNPTKFVRVSIRLTEIHSVHVHAFAQKLWESAGNFKLCI